MLKERERILEIARECTDPLAGDIIRRLVREVEFLDHKLFLMEEHEEHEACIETLMQTQKILKQVFEELELFRDQLDGIKEEWNNDDDDIKKHK